MFTLNIFGSGTDAISLTHRVVLILIVGAKRIKKALGSLVSNRIRATFDRIILHVNTHRLMRSDF